MNIVTITVSREGVSLQEDFNGSVANTPCQVVMYISGLHLTMFILLPHKV